MPRILANLAALVTLAAIVAVALILAATVAPAPAHAATVADTAPWWNGRSAPSIWTREDTPRCGPRLAGRLALLRIDNYGPAIMIRCDGRMWAVTSSRRVSPAVRAELGIPARAFARLHVAATSTIIWAAGVNSPVHVIRS